MARRTADQRMRLFFAVWPPRETAHALHQWAGRAQGACGGRVTRTDRIHLTLAFLGEIDSGRRQDAIRAARAVRGDRHVLPLDEARYQPRNRIVWASPRETPAALCDLAGRLAAALRGSGFALEVRPFAAHVTLIRKARGASQLPPLPAVEWPVREFVLVRSQLSADGSRYETLERFALT
jgi:2'-5' RNA ligase